MSSIRSVNSKLRSSEHGMISIMTTMVLMIVITLIVLGFAQISRRNQRQSLDRQLSTQAFYAAETGVNDARQLLKNAVASGTPITDKTSCGGTWSIGTLNPVIDADKNVSYSCLLVDVSPPQLRYNDVGSTSTVIPMRTVSGNFSRIKIDWQSKVSSTPTVGCPGAGSLPAGTGNGQFTVPASWTCGYGVVRFDLVPTQGAGLTMDGLRNTTMTTFAVPLSSGGTASIPYAASTANTNNVVGVSCSNTLCSLEITGLSQNSYALRIMSLYRTSTMQISATGGAATPIDIAGAQAQIDVTGKAQDVLRRIQVNVPLRGSSKTELSDYAIQSTDSLCKRFAAMNGYFDNEASLAGVSTIAGNRLCSSSP